MRTACVFLIILFFFAEYSVNGTHSAADQQFLGKDSERTDIAFLFGKARIDDPLTAVGRVVFPAGFYQFLADVLFLYRNPPYSFEFDPFCLFWVKWAPAKRKNATLVTFSLLFIRLEIVDRTDHFQDLRGRTDIGNDLLHALVGHRTFVQCARIGSRGEDAVHLLQELFGGKRA